MRGLRPAALAATLLIGAGLAFPAVAMPVIVEAQPILEFKGQPVGGRVDGLIWRGGLNLNAESDLFGGLSSISFAGEDGHLIMVTDQGQFLSGQLIYDEQGAPAALIGVEMTPIRNSKGAELPRAFARDAEAVETIVRDGAPAAIRVGFENLTRVADFALVNNRPEGAAREVAIPQWLSGTRTNGSLEAVCIAPPASPIAGSTLLLTENVDNRNGDRAATLLGRNDKGPLSLAAAAGYNPTDCAFLPDGDLLVLERGLGLLSFTMQLRRIPAADVAPNSRMQGEIILSASGGDIDNMEGVAVHVGPGGETRITLISDDNFNDWERSLLLEFALPQ